MHRFIKAFRMHGLDEKHGAVLVTYADDFVVLCRRDARQVLKRIRGWMVRIGLALNEDKTCVRNARHEKFDFLGYTFGPMHSPRNGHRYLGAMPSNKALVKARQNIRRHLRPGNQLPWAEVANALNRTLRGWGNYFRYGVVWRARALIDCYVEDRVRRFLRRRHKWTSKGTRRYPDKAVHAELGVLSLHELPKLGFANASS